MTTDQIATLTKAIRKQARPARGIRRHARRHAAADRRTPAQVPAASSPEIAHPFSSRTRKRSTPNHSASAARAMTGNVQSPKIADFPSPKRKSSVASSCHQDSRPRR